VSAGGSGTSTGTSSAGTPAYAKILLALAAALAFASIYFGMAYPQVGFVLTGIVGALNAFAAYLGWGTIAPSGST